MSKDRINTGELASLLAVQQSIAVRDAEDFLKALIEVLEDQLLANDVLKIKGLGTFKLQWNEPRKSVDVNTSEEIIIDGYYKISFTPEPELKEMVNAPYAHLQPVVLGGPEPEDMEEEEVEVVEEEIMKEMEDPHKLADAMRSITEQAIEIKDILAEMNLIGGASKKRHPRPVMVDEDEYLPPTAPSRSAVGSRAQPSVGPPAAPPVNQTVRPTAVPPAQQQPTAPAVKAPVAPSAGPATSNLPFDSSEPSSGEGSIEVWPPVAPQRQVVHTVNDTTSYRKQVTQPVSPAPRMHEPYFPEEKPTEPKRSTVNKQKSGNGLLMLLLGLIGGGVITYLVSTKGVLPEFKWLSDKSESSEMLNLPDLNDTPVQEGNPTSTMEDDMSAVPEADLSAVPDTIASTEIKKPVVESPPVDSLQILFDTPRQYVSFIATEKVIDGSRMTRISERHYGGKEFWVYIYEANRDLLNHPDAISKGMVLKIPRVDPRLIDKSNPRCVEYAISLQRKYNNRGVK